MRSPALSAIAGVLRRPLLSPGGLLLRGASLAVMFAVARLLGMQDYAGIVSGTSGVTAAPVAQVLGVIYLFLHVGFYLVAPVLCIAAGVMALLARAMHGAVAARPGG